MLTDKFVNRHNGPREYELPQMLKAIGVSSLDELIEKTVPPSIMLEKPLRLPEAMSEFEYLNHIKALGKKNKMFRSFIGQGYYGVALLSVIIRNVLENPSWYTSYTPYQAEISQGRLEALLNFQTMIIELTGMEIANASLLDEATAVAEAMIMMFNARSRASVKAGASKFFVDDNIFPQTLDVIVTRSKPLGIDLVIGKYTTASFNETYFGSLIQYPAASGELRDYKAFTGLAHASGALVGVAADLMSLALLTPPSEWGADIAVDAQGNSALRMALQTREQHIKRERATSNICTAQALLATMSGMYAQYHGPEGLKNIAKHIHNAACTISFNLKELGFRQLNSVFFDTLKINPGTGVSIETIKKLALEAEMNFYYPNDNCVVISTDEITTIKEIETIVNIFVRAAGKTPVNINSFCHCEILEEKFLRKSSFLNGGAFNRYHSETEMMRYIKMLERKDFSLTHCMISLGSCTMKLNPATSLFAMSWPEFGNIHPFVPKDQAEGYYQIMDELGEALKEITGFPSISFQPNSGAAGEYAGLMVIREYHITRGEVNRNVVLIP